jgi:hypothetical protein
MKPQATILNIHTFGKDGTRELESIEAYPFDCPELPNARFFVHKGQRRTARRPYWQVSEYITGMECGHGGTGNTRDAAIESWRAFCREYESDLRPLSETIALNIAAYLAQYQTPANA